MVTLTQELVGKTVKFTGKNHVDGSACSYVGSINGIFTDDSRQSIRSGNDVTLSKYNDEEWQLRHHHTRAHGFVEVIN